MRDITRDSVQAFFDHRNFSRGNSRVERSIGGTVYLLHGNLIAVQYSDYPYPELRDAGWQTATTRDRLDAILSRYGWRIVQRDYQWILVSDKHGEEKPWRGSIDVAELVSLDRTIADERSARRARPGRTQ